VVLEPTNKTTCRFQWVCLSRCIRGLAHRAGHQNSRCAGLHFNEWRAVLVISIVRTLFIVVIASKSPVMRSMLP
jgi:hypothetical protein